MAKTIDKECCQRTIDGWHKRIARYYSAFPVIKNVKCDTCTNILSIRVYEKPGTAPEPIEDDSAATPPTTE